MCTVTYISLGENFILNSNRDEAIERANAIPFELHNVHGKEIYFPQDPQAKGTWIAHDPNGFTLCLLNGAKEKHLPQPKYRMSRGLMLLDFYQFDTPQDFTTGYIFTGIEPFTLIITGKIKGVQCLFELVWDENEAVLSLLNHLENYIWSSVTLYPFAIREMRREKFIQWSLEHRFPTQEVCIDFHSFEGDSNDKTNILFEEGNKKTVSISSIMVTESKTNICYKDLVLAKSQIFSLNN
jgi:hypothetical protein